MRKNTEKQLEAVMARRDKIVGVLLGHVRAAGMEDVIAGESAKVTAACNSAMKGLDVLEVSAVVGLLALADHVLADIVERMEAAAGNPQQPS